VLKNKAKPVPRREIREQDGGNTLNTVIYSVALWTDKKSEVKFFH